MALSSRVKTHISHSLWTFPLGYRHLSPNLSQIEILIFVPKPTPTTFSQINVNSIISDAQAKTIGSKLHSFLSFIIHIQIISKSYRFSLHSAIRLQLLLTTSTMNRLFQVNIISPVNYCNTLLIDVPALFPYNLFSTQQVEWSFKNRNLFLKIIHFTSLFTQNERQSW